MRVSIVVAVGAMGSEEDLNKFMELVRADFEMRTIEIAAEFMGGRVTILPIEESIDAPEGEGNGGPGDGGDEGEVREEGVELRPVGREPASEEAEPQDEPGLHSPHEPDLERGDYD